MPQPLLSVRDLKVSYHGQLRQGVAVNHLSFDMAAGEALAIVGESGCGKSTTALALMGLLSEKTRREGSASFAGRDVLALPETEFRKIRGRDIGMVFQEPMTSLNPVYTVGRQIIEVLREHLDISPRAARARALELLDLVSIPDPHRRINAYPHELSGGQRQRIVIAMAIALSPRLLIADEPTTALDATVQAQILDILDKLRRDLSMSLLLISHDLQVVSRWTDRVLVMHNGCKVEDISANQLFSDSRHPYTRGLIESSLRLDQRRHYTHGLLPEIRITTRPNGGFHYETHTPQPRLPVAQPSPVASTQPLLKAERLTIRYPSGWRKSFTAVQDVSFEIARGETLGLVGESGSGKSSLSRAVMRLQAIRQGRLLFDGHDITHIRGAPLKRLRRNIQMVFQDPYGSLNPRHTVTDILEAMLIVHGQQDRQAISQHIATVLDQVGLPLSAGRRYPHEFSGGQRQRIAIARAIILQPRLIICDEPVSALDVSVQAQILNLLVDLKAEFGLSYLFISHDLAVVQYISDRIMVMKDGQFVETGHHQEIWQNPQHDYTRRLIAAA